MATTPPPPEVHTPTAPLHGPMFDAPHISNRKSDRIRNQKRAERTPSPIVDNTSSSFGSEAPNELRRTPKAKRSSSSRQQHHHHNNNKLNLSPPSSPLGPDLMTMASAKKPAASSAGKLSANSGLLAAQAGLPTPMKTPRKQILLANTDQAARVLFSNGNSGDQSQQQQQHLTGNLPTPMSSKKRSKRMRKSVGFSLDDDLERATGGQAGIEIYTDSREMIPELDNSVDNPFYEQPGAPKKKYPKRQIKPKEEAHKYEKGVDALSRDRGYIAVGRGRRFFKKIDEASDPELHSPTFDHHNEREVLEEQMDEDEKQGAYAEPESNASHFTRRSLRPRRLFSQELGKHAETNGHKDLADEDDDAEAVTDIEDPEKHGISTQSAMTGYYPLENEREVSDEDKEDEEESVDIVPSPDFVAPLIGVPKGSKEKTGGSPFDSWPRRKPSRTRTDNSHAKAAQPATPVKREGERLDSVAKRLRGSQQ